MIPESKKTRRNNTAQGDFFRYCCPCNFWVRAVLSCEHHSSCPTDTPVVLPYVLSILVSFRSWLCCLVWACIEQWLCHLALVQSFLTCKEQHCCSFHLCFAAFPLCLWDKQTSEKPATKKKYLYALCGGKSDCEKIWGGGGRVGVVLKCPCLCF